MIWPVFVFHCEQRSPQKRPGKDTVGVSTGGETEEEDCLLSLSKSRLVSLCLFQRPKMCLMHLVCDVVTFHGQLRLM